MRCDRCGAPTRVEYTKAQPQLFRVERTRLCYNGHRFKTYEVHKKAFGYIRAREYLAYVRGAVARVELYAKDLKIYTMWAVQKVSLIALARKTGVSERTLRGAVNRIRKDRERR